MLDTTLSEKQIEFMEHYYCPTSMTECLIPENLNAPQNWNANAETIYLRPYQFPMQNYSYMYANDLKKSIEENVRIKKGAGDCYNIGARNIGKSFFLKIDMFLAYIHHLGELCLASFDDYHLKKIATPIADILENHKFAKIFHLKNSRKNSIQRDPLNAKTEHGCTIESANEHIKGNNPGEQFHAKHFDYFPYEEFCVDGKTQIRWVNKEGNIFSGTISKFINSELWKECLVYSYNYEKKRIELKPVSNIFQKKVKDYGYWELKFENYGNTEYRKLITSQHQKIWTKDGYKEVEDISENDEFYTFDYYKLTTVQKEILIGTLLGDSCVNRKAQGKCHPSLHFVHGLNQMEYLKYKKSCFANLYRSFHRQKNSSGWNFQKTSYGGEICHSTTDTCLDFYEFLDFKKPILDKDLLDKYLTPIGLAFWVMDDGQLIGNKGKTDKVKYIHLNTQGFSKKSHDILKDVLKEKFDLDVNIIESKRFDKMQYVLKFDNTNTLKLINLIKDYIHPTFYYKIYTKIELCNFIYNKKSLEFIDLSKNVDDLLQPVKLLSKKFITQRYWTMHDIEVADNHNFFAGGILISNSYASSEGSKKRIDSGNSLGYIFRPSGIPDLCVGSPLGKILQDKKLKNWICQMPQMCREDWSEKVEEEKSDEYGGRLTAAYKLNILAETIPGAFGFFDMERLEEASIKKSKSVKFFELSKDNFTLYEQLLHVDRPAGTEQVFICADLGFGAAPTEIVIIFFDGKKYKLVYNISLLRLSPEEQPEIFKYLYDKLGGAFIALDSTSDSGAMIDRLFKMGIDQEHLLKVIFSANIEVDFEKDKDGHDLCDDKGNPIMKKVRTDDWSFKELERIMYDGSQEIPYDAKFINQFTNVIATKTKGKLLYGSKGENHLVQAYQVFAICRFFNEFKSLRDGRQEERTYGVFNTRRK